MPIVGGFGAPAGNGCCANAVNGSNAPMRISTKPGRMRRVHLRGPPNILKRVLVHICGFNLGLLMRQLTGVGTPRSLQGRAAAAFDALMASRSPALDPRLALLGARRARSARFVTC